MTEMVHILSNQPQTSKPAARKAAEWTTQSCLLVDILINTIIGLCGIILPMICIAEGYEKRPDYVFQNEVQRLHMQYGICGGIKDITDCLNNPYQTYSGDLHPEPFSIRYFFSLLKQYRETGLSEKDTFNRERISQARAAAVNPETLLFLNTLEFFLLPKEEQESTVQLPFSENSRCHTHACAQAELLFARFLHPENPIEAEERFHIYVDRNNKPLLIETYGPTIDRLCLSLQPIALDQLLVPAGSILTHDRESYGLPEDPWKEMKTARGVICVEPTMQSYYFHRLSGFSVASDSRMRAFGRLFFAWQEEGILPYMRDVELDSFRETAKMEVS